MPFRGKRRKVVKILKDSELTNEKQYAITVLLECGHIVKTAYGYSKNHRRGKKKVTAYCAKCAYDEVVNGIANGHEA